MYAGMSTAAGPRAWAPFAAPDDRAFVGVLKGLARGVDLRRYRKAKRDPKKRRLPWSGDKRVRHVATARLLALRKMAKASP